LAGCHKPQKALRIAGAADLARAFDDVGHAFAAEGHAMPIFSFGSTGLLAKQIEEGAPYDVFAAANLSFVDDTVKANVCDGKSQAMYARGRIVLWAPPGKQAPKDIKKLATNEYVKIAIANPEHAPYGRAAVEALQTAGIYEQVKPKLVFGENVQQTLQFAQSGNAEVAIVALSLATVAGGSFSTVPEELHKPIAQAMVQCSKNADAARFIAFVSSPAGRAIMRRYGFLLPGEVVAQSK
jgi:molybdate transport system substrate-binding protein